MAYFAHMNKAFYLHPVMIKAVLAQTETDRLWPALQSLNTDGRFPLLNRFLWRSDANVSKIQNISTRSTSNETGIPLLPPSLQSDSHMVRQNNYFPQYFKFKI